MSWEREETLSNGRRGLCFGIPRRGDVHLGRGCKIREGEEGERAANAEASSVELARDAATAF